MSTINSAITRAKSFADNNGIRIPILLAPMAGACPTSLSISVANSGGMGACGVLLMSPDEISNWVGEMRARSNGAFQLNTWIPDPDPVRNTEHEAQVRDFLAKWGPKVPVDAADKVPPDFDAQCEAMLEANPSAISSIMGLYPPEFVKRIKADGIKWFATITTVAEAVAAEAAGADVVVAQGMEAGGHRGVFESSEAETTMVGLFSLLPAVVDSVDIPVVATGGIADSRGIAAALLLGASAVQIGTGLLRTPEAKISPVLANALSTTLPEGTTLTRAFSGRLGRTIRTAYALAASSAEAPKPTPYPIQRNLTQPMRTAAVKSGNIDSMQAWAGQSARLARDDSASEVIENLWNETQELLNSA